MSWLPLILLACGGSEDPGSAGPEVAAMVADAGDDRLVQVGEPVSFNAGGSVGAAFRWVLGDGAVAEGVQVEHVYERPGHFTVRLEVTGDDGQVVTDAARITAVWPLLDEPPVSASPLALHDGRLYAALPDFDRVAVVDAEEGVLIEHLETCGGPRTVAAGPSGVAVACDDDAVRILDGGARDVDLGYGARPWGVVQDDVGLWVTLQGQGALARIDGDVEIVASLPDLRGLAVFDGGVLASRWRSPDAGGELLHVGDQPILWTLPLDPGPDSDTNSRGVPSLLQPVVVRPDGRVAYVGGLKANIERGLVRDGLPLTFETTVRADLRVLALHPDEGPLGSQIGAVAFDDRDVVSAVATSEAGDWLFVAHRGMETVDVLDAFSLQRAGAVPGVGHGLEGLAVDGQTLWVLATLSRELVAYDMADPGLPVEVARVDLRPGGVEVRDPVELRGEIVFGRAADPRMASAGYMSCWSCHPDGEHDGRTWDFTDRGEGLRNTSSLRSSVEGPLHWSANFDEVQDFEHDIRGPQQGRGFLSEEDWAATNDPLGAPKAGRSPELDALAAYVRSLREPPRSPHRQPDGSQSALAALGEAIFYDPVVGCADCHPPPETTDSAWLSGGEPLLHDVGTLTPDSGQRLGGPLEGLDTPSLRGLASTAPYLHDGSAPTVRAVLEQGAPHGVTGHLTREELDALAQFLLELDGR